MDKNTLVGFILIGAVVVGFSIYNRPSQEEIARAQREQDSIQAAALVEKARQEKAAAAAQQQAFELDSTSLFYQNTKGTEEFTTLENDLVKVTFSNKGGRIASATLKEYNDQKKQPLVLFDQTDSRINFAFEGKSENIMTEEMFFQPTNVTDSTVTMTLQAANGAHIDFKYSLAPNSYLVNLTVQAEGMKNFFSPSQTTVNIDWKQRVRQMEKGFNFEQRYTSLTYKPVDESFDYLSETSEEKKNVEEQLEWIAFKNQYFSCVFLAEKNFEQTTLSSTPLQNGTGYLKNYSATMKTPFDPTGKEASNFQFYLGPNHFKTLIATNKLSFADKDPELEDLVYLGWPIIRWINRWFTINLFDWLSGLGLSMGVILLLMTIIVKALVYPATYKSYMSSAKMRVLKPKIDEINKKYPKQEDAMKKQQEVMGLYSQYGVSPMGGCLPMLIQFPILMALFMFVPSAIELRQQSFLWADDLSTYDAFINFPFHIPFLGSHLSLFCLLMTVTNILNTKYMMQQQDTGANPQMAAMKWMSYLMPIMFLFILNDYPSGLNYYYFISTLVSVVTTLIMRKTTNEEALLAQLEANKKDPKKMKKTGFAARLEAMQKQQEQMMKERQNKK